MQQRSVTGIPIHQCLKWLVFRLLSRDNSRAISFEMSNFTKWHFALIVISCLSLGHALECYVCTDQEGNRDKCLNTIKTCEQGQDICLTEIKWGSTPYWSQGAKKQFYVSKRCATKRECERLQRSNIPDCTHIWYQDWKCSSCCQGDRCNYYVISGGNGRKVHSEIYIVTILVLLLGTLRFQ